jgi:hypothetical protein
MPNTKYFLPRIALFAAFTAASAYGQVQISTPAIAQVGGTPSIVNATVVLSNPVGVDSTAWVLLLFNNDMYASGGCYIAFVPNAPFSSNPGGLTYLNTDNGADWIAPSPQTIGGGSPISNSQCTLDPANSGVVKTSSTAMTLSLRIGFDPRFKGSMNSYVTAYDSATSLQYASTTMQVWTAWNEIPNSMPVVALAAPLPPGGSGGSFPFVASDPNGYGHLSWVSAGFTQNINSGSAPACSLWYRPAADNIFLIVDGAWMPLAMHQPGTVESQYCHLDAGVSTYAKSGNNIALSLALGFKTAAIGQMKVYSYAASRTAQTGWPAFQTGSPPEDYVYAVSDLPAVLAVTPNATTPPATSHDFEIRTWNPSTPNLGGSLTFALSYSPNEYGSACWLLYYPSSNQAYLFADDGVHFAVNSPQPFGSGAQLQNSQCTINTASSTAPSAGNGQIIKIAVTFLAPFMGTNYIYVNSAAEGRECGARSNGLVDSVRAHIGTTAATGDGNVSGARGDGRHLHLPGHGSKRVSLFDVAVFELHGGS